MTLRQTKQKQAILEFLMKTKNHPAPEVVFRAVKKKQPRLGLGTVYRNLTTLSKQKIVEELIDEKGIKRYDANISPHQHFYCFACGRISDVFINCEIKNRQLKKMGYQVDGINLKFKGRCPKCKNKNKNG